MTGGSSFTADDMERYHKSVEWAKRVIISAKTAQTKMEKQYDKSGIRSRGARCTKNLKALLDDTHDNLIHSIVIVIDADNHAQH